MLKSITPKKIIIKETNKQGVPFKFNSVSVGICITDKNEQDMWLNGFMKKDEANSIQEGQALEVEVWNDEKWGWKFKVPSRLDQVERRLTKLEETVYQGKTFREHMEDGRKEFHEAQEIANQINGQVITTSNVSTPVNPEDKGINVEEIPF